MLKPNKAALITSIAAIAILFASSEGYSQNRRPRAPRNYRGVANEPYVSPYLNLVRPGADPGFNYYTLVQPQVQQEQFNLQQGQQMFGLNRQIQQTQAEIMTPYGPRATLRATGHSGASYMNYSHFYPKKGIGPSGGGRKYSSSMGGGGMGMGGMGMPGMGGMGGMGMY